MVKVVAKQRGSDAFGSINSRRAAWTLLLLTIGVCLVRLIPNAREEAADTIVNTSSSYTHSSLALADFKQLKAAEAVGKSTAYVVYGHFSTDDFKTRVAESLKTWLKDSKLYYVLNKKWKKDYEAFCASNKELSEICSRIIPIHVDCPPEESENGGGSPCCKMDQGMTAMWRDYSTYDWYVYLDDDIYIRTAFMNDFLSGLSPSQPMILTPETPQSLQVEEQRNCASNNDPDFLYPMGESVMVYSRAALEEMSKAFEMNAVSTQCLAFGHATSSYEKSNALVHWMYGVPHVRLPTISGAYHEHFHSTFKMIGLHGASNKQLGRNKDIEEIHRHVQYRRHPKPPYAYQWHKPRGFLKTKTYQEYGDIEDWTEWHVLSPLECLGTTGNF